MAEKHPPAQPKSVIACTPLTLAADPKKSPVKVILLRRLQLLLGHFPAQRAKASGATRDTGGTRHARDMTIFRTSTLNSSLGE